MAGRPGFLAAGILAIGLGLATGAHAQSCNLQRLASFDISPQPDGLATIPVTVEGKRENFLVDTGGYFSTISSPLAKSLDLTVQPLNRNIEIYAADGAMLDHYVNVHPLIIGGARFGDVHLMLDPVRGVARPNGFQGTLAEDLLGRLDLDFDFGAHKLNLFSQKHCKGRVVYWAPAYAVVPFTLDDNHINLAVTLDGKTFTASLDTGSSFTLLSASAANRAFGLRPHSPGMKPTGETGPNALVPYRYRFKSLSLNGVAVRNPDIGIMLDKAAESFWKHHTDKPAHNVATGYSFQPDPVILGMDVLRQLHIYIAYGEQKLYVTAASAGHASANASAGGGKAAAAN